MARGGKSDDSSWGKIVWVLLQTEYVFCKGQSVITLNSNLQFPLEEKEW